MHEHKENVLCKMNECAYKTDNSFFFFKLSNGLEWINQNKAANRLLFFWVLSLCKIKEYVSLFDTQINSKNSISFEGGFHCTSWLFHFHGKQRQHFLLHRYEWKYCDLIDFVCVCLRLDLVICKREIVSFFFHSIFRHFTQYAKIPAFFLSICDEQLVFESMSVSCYFMLLSPLATIYCYVINILHDLIHTTLYSISEMLR